MKSNFSSNFFDVFNDKASFVKPVETKIVLGKIMYDKNNFNDGINFVVSDRFVNILIDNNLTGWKTYPVEIKNIKETYHGFQIIGKSGSLRKYEKKGFYIGYEFDKSSWDGTDFFTPSNTSLRFLSKKAKEILNDSGLTNIEIRNIKEVEHYSPAKN